MSCSANMSLRTSSCRVWGKKNRLKKYPKMSRFWSFSLKFKTQLAESRVVSSVDAVDAVYKKCLQLLKSFEYRKRALQPANGKQCFVISACALNDVRLWLQTFFKVFQEVLSRVFVSSVFSSYHLVQWQPAINQTHSHFHFSTSYLFYMPQLRWQLINLVNPSWVHLIE